MAATNPRGGRVPDNDDRAAVPPVSEAEQAVEDEQLELFDARPDRRRKEWRR